MTALRASSALRCESMKSTCTLRPASLPWPFWYLANACTPLTTAWDAPGRTGVSTSAITAIRIVSAVTPISLSGDPPGWFCARAAPPARDTDQPSPSPARPPPPPGNTPPPPPTATATSAHRLRFTFPPRARFPPPGTPRCAGNDDEITVFLKPRSTPLGLHASMTAGRSSEHALVRWASRGPFDRQLPGLRGGALGGDRRLLLDARERVAVALG